MVPSCCEACIYAGVVHNQLCQNCNCAEVSPAICCSHFLSAPTPPSPLPPGRMKLMYNHVNPKNDQRAPLIAQDVYKIIVDVSAASNLRYSCTCIVDALRLHRRLLCHLCSAPHTAVQRRRFTS